MPEHLPDEHLARFGVFEADLRSGELRKSGVKIKLRDQAFQVLAELLERPGEVVTREELRDRLWPDGTFVDFDHSLNAAVNSVREVLGDSAASPRFVETLPRRGYRFIAPVEREGDTVHPPIGPPPTTQTAIGSAAPPTPSTLPPSPGDQPAATATGDRRIHLRRAIWAVSLIAVVVLVAVTYRLSNRPELQVPPSPTKTYLTSYPGHEMQPSFSPDGSQVTYAWGDRPTRTFDIYVKLIGVEPPRQITMDPLDEFNPVWSPDGRWIAFLRKLDESRAEVLLTDPFGTRERKLSEVSTVASFRFRHLAWSPDSESLVVVDHSPPAENGSLFLVSVDTGETQQLVVPPPGTYLDASPSFSPDGRRLVFVRFLTGTPAGDLFLLDLSQDRPKRISSSLLSAPTLL